jgi:hypothetical protein
MTLRSGKIVTGGKINIVCWECGIKGHYSNEYPKKLNPAPTTYHTYPKPRNY